MSTTRQRRPLVAPGSGASEGFFSDSTPPERQLIPGTLAACPTACTPRPRNLPEYQAACRAAQGADVRERNACEIVKGMRVYQTGRFLEVVATDRHDPRGDVEIRMAGHGIVATRIAALSAPVYILAPTSDAYHAPDAGASAGESTAVRHG